MKVAVAILATALLGYLLSGILPWWNIAIAAAVVALFIFQRPSLAFFSGFVGIFTLWLFAALYISQQNGGFMVERMSLLFGSSGFALILLGAALGGFTAGLAALCGSLLRKTLQGDDS